MSIPCTFPKKNLRIPHKNFKTCVTKKSCRDFIFLPTVSPFIYPHMDKTLFRIKNMKKSLACN